MPFSVSDFQSFDIQSRIVIEHGDADKLLLRLNKKSKATATIAAAAKKAGVGEATIYRFLRDDTFKNEYRNARRDVVENTVGQIQGATASAVKTLKKNLTCDNASAEIRAAQIILETAYKGVEMIDLQMRLEILEAEQQKMNETIGKKNY